MRQTRPKFLRVERAQNRIQHGHFDRMQLRSAAASALCNRNPQTAMAWRTVCPQGRPAPCSPPVHRKISLCVEARCSFVTHSTGTGAAHAIEARRRRRSRCGRCASVSPAGQHKLTRVRFVRPRVPDALEASPLIHKQSLLRIHKHVPETLIVHSSALEPLLAVGIGVPRRLLAGRSAVPRSTPLLPKANMSKRRTKQPTADIVHDDMARRRRRSRCTQCGSDRSARQCKCG